MIIYYFLVIGGTADIVTHKIEDGEKLREMHEFISNNKKDHFLELRMYIITFVFRVFYVIDELFIFY